MSGSQLKIHTTKNANHSSDNSQPSKIALVCDWLTTPGGAEKVLLELHRLYPEAPIYTSQYRPKKIDWFADAQVKTGWLQFFPSGLRKILGPLRQLYFSHLDLSDYDLVISVTGAEAKSVKTKKNPKKIQGSSFHYSTQDKGSQEGKAKKSEKSQNLPENDKNSQILSENADLGAKEQSERSVGAFHLCYCHVPTQYYWQFYDRYMENPGLGILNPIFRLGLRLLSKPLRRADYRAAQRPDQFIAISRYSARQIRRYYDRSAIVIAPPVAVENFTPQNVEERSGYIISCRQVAWKRVDLAIKACLATGNQLTVIGAGPEHQRLRELADRSFLINFVPWLDQERLAEYLCNAEGYIFPSLEPFGIAPVEALAAGCPVLAYDRGGSRDFIEPGKNGIFFNEQTAESLQQALDEFEKYQFDEKVVSESAQKFSPSHFCAQIEQLVTKIQAGDSLADLVQSTTDLIAADDETIKQEVAQSKVQQSDDSHDAESDDAAAEVSSVAPENIVKTEEISTDDGAETSSDVDESAAETSEKAVTSSESSTEEQGTTTDSVVGSLTQTEKSARRQRVAELFQKDAIIDLDEETTAPSNSAQS